MKKLFLLLAILGMVAVGCTGPEGENVPGNEDVPSGEDYLIFINNTNVNPTMVAGGGMVNITFTTEYDWAITTNVDWLSTSETNGFGGTVDFFITASANKTDKERKGIVTITLDEVDKEYKIRVTQAPNEGIKHIDESFIPQLSGYYGTVAKKDASVALMGQYVPIYAEWKYGEGSVGSFMCDLSGIWSDEFMSDLVGQAIITNIVNSLFPMQDVRADGIDYVIKSDNYHYQINVHGVAENERIEVEVTPMSDHLVDALEEGVNVNALESNRRFNFIIKDAGLYEIVIRKYDEAGVELAKVVTYESFSYSEEYNVFTERVPIGEELMTLLANDGKGMVVTDPAEVFESFAQTIKKVLDPRVLFLILSIIFVLLDIASRKFKFKWPHEIIREYKFKKADEATKNS